MSSEDLKAKVAAAQATLDALNALNAQKAAQEQEALEQAQAQEQSQDGNNSDSSDSAKEHKDEPAKQEHYCFINRVYIRPQERHQGAATKLLEQAISFAKEQECQQIILSTIATYQSALNLYQKMGFTELDPNKLPENIKVKARTIYLGLTLQEPENSHAWSCQAAKAALAWQGNAWPDLARHGHVRQSKSLPIFARPDLNR